jgi:hypothetical protein
MSFGNLGVFGIEELLRNFVLGWLSNQTLAKERSSHASIA